MIEKRTFSIPAEQAVYIDALVEGGDYASASEVVRAGLRALRERESAIERWLEKEVVPVYDKMKKNPKRAVSATQVFATLRTRHQTRSAKAKK